MTFTLQSYRRLKSKLGKLDAIVECNELALRGFINQAAQHTSEKELKGFITSQSEQYKVQVNAVDLNQLGVKVAQLYILLVYQQAEEFFQDFREEHPYSSAWKYDNGDTILVRILNNIGDDYDQNVKCIGELRFEIFDYYHLVRNRFMHSKIRLEKLDNQTKKIQEIINNQPNHLPVSFLCADKKLDEIDNKVRAKRSYNINGVPNVYRSITFEDFLLFSKLVKDIAYLVCQLSRPSDIELADWILENPDSKVILSKFRRRKQNEERYKNSIFGLVNNLYGLQKNEAQGVVEALIKKMSC